MDVEDVVRPGGDPLTPPFQGGLSFLRRFCLPILDEVSYVIDSRIEAARQPKSKPELAFSRINGIASFI